MDTIKDCKIPYCGSLKDMSNFKMVVGSKQLRKALENGRAKFVYLAENADPAITDPIVERCQLNHISYAWVRTMQELGSACGIEVGAAAAAAVE